ncbi:MAG: TRAP transporter large permease, partial [Clostridia bacterium]|nr:TRAP transporter large permease [Clostridia bacterium]
CGSAQATVAAIGGLMIPSMIRQGYRKDFSGAVAACSGGLGVLIPPSIPLILYGISVGVSITDLFVATIVPGVLTGIAMIIVSVFISKKNNWRGSGDEFGFKAFIKALWDGKWAVLAPVIILGGIYGGVFTPTEAGVIAVVYSIVVGVFLHRELKFSVLPGLLFEAAIMSSVVMIIVGFSSAFGQIMSLYRIPDMIAKAILNISSSKFVILLLIDVLMLVLGTFMDTGPIIIIFAPLLVPLCKSVGINTVFLGVLICLATEIGMMTPPLGCNLFVAQKIGGLGLGEIFKACLPLIAAQLAVLILLTLFPGIVTMVL